MGDFLSFLAGVFFGGAGSSSSKNTKKSEPPKTNIALQDVAFCQGLRNRIDGLEEYVGREHPSPEEFIRYMLPKYNFQEPYTAEETRLLKENEANAQSYLHWIQTELASSGEKWEDLTATRMIWRDLSHTPDVDNLDLMFGDSYFAQPVKKNGRVYEYRTEVPLTGLAAGFFESIPAKYVLQTCLALAQGTVTSHGYTYDFTRYESGTQTSIWDLSKKDRRKSAYKQLLEEKSWLCKNPWSDLTRGLKALDDYRKAPQAPLDEKEELRRNEEINKVYAALTPQEKDAFAVGTIKTHNGWAGTIYFFGGLAIAVLLFLIGSIFVGIDPVGGVAEKWWDASLVVAIVTVLPSMLCFVIKGLSCTGESAKKEYEERTRDYLLTLQTSFYNKADDWKAIQYAELLKRL